MKKLILIAIAFIGLQGIAQEEKKGNNHSKNDLTPEQIATLKTKKMILELDLSSSQQTEIHAINLEQAKKRKAIMTKRKANKDGEKRDKPTSEERYNKENAKLDHQIAMKAKMKSILNKEQFEKWEKMQMHKKKKGKDKRQKAECDNSNEGKKKSKK